MTPAAPLVGAVTTRWPAAFSSLTASAKRFTQSMARMGSAGVDTHGLGPSAAREPERRASLAASALARRGTSRPPGRIPWALVPASTQSNMVFAMRSRWASTTARGRTASSLARTSSAIDRPDSAQAASSWAAVAKGCGAGTSMPTPDWLVARDATWGSEASSLVWTMTNPPPTE